MAAKKADSPPPALRRRNAAREGERGHAPFRAWLLAAAWGRSHALGWRDHWRVRTSSRTTQLRTSMRTLLTRALRELADKRKTLALLSLELSSPSWTASTSSVCALRLGTEVGLHRGGDRGRRWSLSEEQAHLLGGIRRREPSKAAVDDGLQGLQEFVKKEFSSRSCR